MDIVAKIGTSSLTDARGARHSIVTRKALYRNDVVDRLAGMTRMSGASVAAAHESADR